MKMIPYTNNTQRPQTIAGKTINPGETREVDARFVPATPDINSSLFLLFFNVTDETKYFGSVAVEGHRYGRLPANHFVDPNTPADKAQQGLFRALLDQKIDYIKERLPAFTPDELAVLKSIEEQAKGKNKRKGLLSAIDEEVERQNNVLSFDAEAYKQELAKMKDDELDLELLNAGDDQAKIELIQAELSSRKDAE
ncbi:hypothetical protein HMF8227_02366 [Saliniradius amylolyticus]|uniref:Uncharacterized protein n=1 Tax=Saliniradius amylolyticus TaxID=2183582 RepID=A0A2S2E584_9ALTE|nr:ABC transporter ATPase [Saliniradius amylolyticus]AWL12818.1 hypothetical protein HMF8227_02366 [Saliniradius amylolyticus]